MINFDDNVLVFGKEKLKVDDINLKTALELENYGDKNVGFMLDASTNELITQPLGDNNVNISGVFLPDSRVLDFLKAEPGSFQEYIDELKANRSQYYLHQIMVDKDLRGKGLGSKMIELSEYLYAKYMRNIGEKSGFITGTFFPIGQKEDITRSFYEKNGFIITETSELYKNVLVEEVMDRVNRREFERLF